tara:strand:- start:222 stop:1781 length:1560 start_codon:yes stop_codon:yes gene_type:complete
MWSARLRRSILLISCGLGASRLAICHQPIRALPPPTLGTIARSSLVQLHASAAPQSEDEQLTPILSVNPLLDASLPHRILAFYAIHPLSDPDAAVEDHRRFLSSQEMVGRVYLSANGLNAQVSGTVASCAAYREFVTQRFTDTQLLFKEDPVAELAFPKLRVKAKELVPQMGDQSVDLSERGIDLTPEEWDAMLKEQGDEALVLDVRNDYEWDVGRFAGAAKPELRHFAKSEDAYELPEAEADRAEKPVMMYCTGGIRCEYFSAKLKAEGFKKVYKLQGGIQHYGNAYAKSSEPPPHWKGSLFVFDRRNTIPLGSGGAPVVGECMHCGAPTEALINCCNIDCNKLHLTCEKCLGERRGFCTTVRRAPQKEQVPKSIAHTPPTPKRASAQKHSTHSPHPNPNPYCGDDEDYLCQDAEMSLGACCGISFLLFLVSDPRIPSAQCTDMLYIHMYARTTSAPPPHPVLRQSRLAQAGSALPCRMRASHLPLTWRFVSVRRSAQRRLGGGRCPCWTSLIGRLKT